MAPATFAHAMSSTSNAPAPSACPVARKSAAIPRATRALVVASAVYFLPTTQSVPRVSNLFPLRFGNDSYKPHHAAAKATGKPCIVLELPGIAVDVDNPEDLQQLMSLPGETRAQQFAREVVSTAKK